MINRLLNCGRALIIIVMFFMMINPGQSASAAAPIPAPATDLYATTLWNTGVNGSGTKLGGGAPDPHYELESVSVGTKDGGTYAHSDTKPLCQPGASSDPLHPSFPASAIVVQEYGGTAGTSRVYPYQHPWKSSFTNSAWIGANASGLDTSTKTCPNPSDFHLAYLWGGPYSTDPKTGAKEPPTGPEWVPTWNIYTFSAIQPFSIHASPAVDTNSLRLTILGTADNELAVSLDKCGLLQATSSPVDEQTDSTPFPNPAAYTNWADPHYFEAQRTTTFSVPAHCLDINGKTPTNKIKFLVKSGDDLTGLLISKLSIDGNLLPIHPYFTVNGGDAVAGMTFASGHTCNQINSPSQASQAVIRSWNDDGGAGSYYGAGSQAGALALGQISSFVTGLNPAAKPGDTPALQNSLSQQPSELSFANTSFSPPPFYGGNFGSYGGCADDYYGSSYLASAASPAGSVDLSSITSGVHSYINNITLKGKLSQGIHATIVVKGSVAITGDISYAPYSVNSVPSLTVISNDNIYVSGSVQEIHGFYVAQGGKSPNDGTFATCAPQWAKYMETTNYDTCNGQLTVYGAVAANAIHLDRSYGSIIGGGVGEPPAQPAEIFRFTPEAWLGGICPADPANCLKNKSDYSVITDLPPIL